MKRANIRELRHHTSAVLERVARGETVEICRRNRPIARITPIPPETPVELPDFRRRLDRVYGSTCLATTGTAVVSEGRGDR